MKKILRYGPRRKSNKSELFIEEATRLGHDINEQGEKPKKEKIQAILRLKSSKPKKLKTISGAIQNIAVFLPRLLEKNCRIKKLSKKRTKRKSTEDEETFNRKKECQQQACLAHLVGDRYIIVTIDAGKTGFG